jgi:hypothetical protein
MRNVTKISIRDFSNDSNMPYLQFHSVGNCVLSLLKVIVTLTPERLVTYGLQSALSLSSYNYVMDVSNCNE